MISYFIDLTHQIYRSTTGFISLINEKALSIFRQSFFYNCIFEISGLVSENFRHIKHKSFGLFPAEAGVGDRLSVDLAVADLL